MTMKGEMYKMMLMMAMMGSMSSPGSHHWEELTAEDIAEIKRVREASKLNRMKKRGMKEWDMDGFTVLALNEKNAIRKINNLKDKLKTISNEK